MKSTLLVVVAAIVAAACSGSMTDSNTGIVVKAGTWSYSLTESIPTPTSSCMATASGTATVGGDGTYAITFPALSCSGCTMTASASGTITTMSIGGTVSASIAGSGCSSQQPTPSPAQTSGTCNATSCQASTNQADSFAVTYTLTPPA